MKLADFLKLIPDFQKVNVMNLNTANLLCEDIYANDLVETYDDKEVHMISTENSDKVITIWIDDTEVKS